MATNVKVLRTFARLKIGMAISIWTTSYVFRKAMGI